MEKPKATSNREIFERILSPRMPVRESIDGEPDGYADLIERAEKALGQFYQHQLDSTLKSFDIDISKLVPSLEWDESDTCAVAQGVAGVYTVAYHSGESLYTAELADGGVRLIPDYFGGLHYSLEDAKQACEEDDADRIFNRLKLNP